MILQYSALLSVPRKIFKYFLNLLYPFFIRLFPLPKVHSIPETIDCILKNQYSICRFGDSEFLYLVERRDLPYQKQNERLREYFIRILNSDYPNILVGLPIGYHSLENLKPEAKILWRAVIVWTYLGLRKYLNQDKTYYNSSMTRLFIDYQDTTHCKDWFNRVRLIWNDKDILLIEGEKSRLGIGNDLFSNAKSIKRILGPAHESFSQFDNLLQCAKSFSKSHLVLIAMGPTAKPIAFELALFGFQALDIGNLDIEYEWFLKGAKKKVIIDGKYTSEAKGGRNVSDISDDKYLNQIVARYL